MLQQPDLLQQHHKAKAHSSLLNDKQLTPNELGQKLGEQLNKIINTPGIQLAKIKISCSVSGPPITITCTITFGIQQILHQVMQVVKFSHRES